jgi:hypothetical protein
LPSSSAAARRETSTLVSCFTRPPQSPVHRTFLSSASHPPPADHGHAAPPLPSGRRGGDVAAVLGGRLLRAPDPLPPHSVWGYRWLYSATSARVLGEES